MQLINYLSNIDGLQSWYKQAAEFSGRLLVLGLNGSYKIVALENLLETQKRTVVVIVATEFQAQRLVDEWRGFSKFPIHLFPVNDIFSAEMAVASKENLVDRISTLDFLLQEKTGAVVVTAASAKHLLSDVDVWKEAHIEFNYEDNYDLEKIKEQLFFMGYNREAQVEKPGDYSVRGSIIDIYPLTAENPVRIDFFDDEIDSIRSFDFTTQRSITTLDTIAIPPATDLLITKEQFEKASGKLAIDLEKAYATNKTELAKFLDDLYSHWTKGEKVGIERAYLTYFIDEPKTIFDYINDAYYIVDDYSRVNEAERKVDQDVSEWITQKLSENQLMAELLVVAPLHNQLLKLKNVTFLSVLQKGMGNLRFQKVYNIAYQPMSQFFGQLPFLKSECERFLKRDYTIILLVSTKEKEQKLAKILEDLDLEYILNGNLDIIAHKLQIVNFPLSIGFELSEDKVAVITEKEIFNTTKTKKRRLHREQLSNAERLKSYNELKVGDYVVHTNHGIGKYLGMETLEVDGNHQDYLTIMYRNDDKLFIPVTQLDLIQKYVAQDGVAPKINKLGGTEWHKTKQKAAHKIEDIADELIELYAKREAKKGFAFAKDDEMQRLFEEAFSYVETEDQLRSTKEIKRDMEKARPMDRLLVGDVGYGKTEVALRAACKAVCNKKQVVFLVPTTILAQQHYETIKRRFADFPVNVELLNRFKTKKQQVEILDKLMHGEINIIVGTHRILSKDVEFSDLGLLIIDEEQRFGVKHKERLKQLKNQVDVLTLTATPIPRTLHMSMVGVRDLSVLETPPKDRYPVQTYVLERNNSVIKEAIERELARKGQVFYLFNRVKEMENKVQELQQIVPDARIGYAHGQMTEHELENVLLEFLEGEYDVLVTTTIVETGVDMPNVNTIFVDHADKMGLSQLYQLRGRVGRSNRVAYAYFMYEPMQILTEVSEQRLEAIKEFTDLGSGFKIAMRDLSIRGAGNLLGAAQHGFMNEIGFDLYTQMLEEAIMKKQGQIPEISEVETTVNIKLDAYLPSTYIKEQRLKIEMYKRLKEAKTLEVIDELEDELFDRFGEYPKEVSYLLQLTRLKIKASKARVSQVVTKGDKVALLLTAEASKLYRPEDYMSALEKIKLKVRFNPTQAQMELQFLIKDIKNAVWLQEVESFLDELANNYQELIGEKNDKSS